MALHHKRSSGTSMKVYQHFPTPYGAHQPIFIPMWWLPLTRLRLSIRFDGTCSWTWRWACIQCFEISVIIVTISIFNLVEAQKDHILKMSFNNTTLVRLVLESPFSRMESSLATQYLKSIQPRSVSQTSWIQILLWKIWRDLTWHW